MNHEGQRKQRKKYDPLDRKLVFVQRKNEIDPMFSDSEDDLVAEMSCGHAVTPESLTQWCRHLLDQGIYKFKCPAVVKGTQLCNHQWSYREVRRMAVLTVEEMQHYEDTTARLAAADYCDFQACPQCKTIVERKDFSNLCVNCLVCTAEQKKSFNFCWQCLRKWKGPAPESNRCGNDGCINKDLQVLQSCGTITMPEVKGVTSCPAIRACPTCGMRVEHNEQHCKNIYCRRCHVEFCFICLKLKRECIKTSSPYEMCPAGVAPRQTAIPIWKR